MEDVTEYSESWLAARSFALSEFRFVKKGRMVTLVVPQADPRGMWIFGALFMAIVAILAGTSFWCAIFARSPGFGIAGFLVTLGGIAVTGQRSLAIDLTRHQIVKSIKYLNRFAFSKRIALGAHDEIGYFLFMGPVEHGIVINLFQQRTSHDLLKIHGSNPVDGDLEKFTAEFASFCDIGYAGKQSGLGYFLNWKPRNKRT